MPPRTRRSTPRSARSRQAMPRYGLAAVGVGGITYLLLTRVVVGHHPYALWLAAWSVAGFAFYGIDKSNAQRGRWRVPEAVLHALAFVGGVAGCWLGMLVFRHKTQSTEFKLALIVATMIHGALVLSLPGR